MISARGIVRSPGQPTPERHARSFEFDALAAEDAERQQNTAPPGMSHLPLGEQRLGGGGSAPDRSDRPVASALRRALSTFVGAS